MILASTTQGKPLDESELQVVMEGCEMAIELYEERMNIHQFVEQRMTLIAPNRKPLALSIIDLFF